MSPSRASKSEHQKHFFLLFAVSLRSTLEQYFCRFSHDFKRLSSAFLTFHFFFPFYFILFSLPPLGRSRKQTKKKAPRVIFTIAFALASSHSILTFTRFIATISTWLLNFVPCVGLDSTFHSRKGSPIGAQLWRALLPHLLCTSRKALCKKWVKKCVEFFFFFIHCLCLSLEEFI